MGMNDNASSVASFTNYIHCILFSLCRASLVVKTSLNPPYAVISLSYSKSFFFCKDHGKICNKYVQ